MSHHKTGDALRALNTHRGTPMDKLPSARLTEALGLLQDAQSKIERAAEELHIVDAEMIGSDEHRRLIVASSAENPIGVADDISSHRAQAVEISEFAAAVAKAARAVKGKGSFLAQALGSVYRDEIQAGDEARRDLFPEGGQPTPTHRHNQ